MSAVTAVQVADGLYLIPGHHPESMWTDSNVPNVMVYLAGRELYLLDSGLGPAQRQAILDLGRQLQGRFDHVTLLNSHAHVDHMGNNDLKTAFGVPARHFISALSAPYFDTMSFFRNAYNEGAEYFDYVAGLRVDAESLMPLLVRAGLPPDTDRSRLTEVAQLIGELGLTRVISHFIGDLMVRNISETYPPVHIEVEGASHYESLPREEFRYGAARWSGWRIGDVCVFEAHGHTLDGVIFYLPDAEFVFLADETTTIPIWRDTDPEAAAGNLRNILAMVDEGAATGMAAGHFPLEVVTGAERMTAALEGLLGQKAAFEGLVDAAVATFPGPFTIDDLYDRMTAAPTGMTTAFLQMQFPKLPTFFKLTLLNHCRAHLTETTDLAARRAFTVSS